MSSILNYSYGYGFALGIGAAFALLMICISKLLSKYMRELQNSERFSTASRSVKSGLISSSTVSAWTWPATLLSSGAWGYSHGISGPFLYGIGGTIQILLFVFLAIEIKRNSPGCHTVAQLISVPFGKGGHICYLCYCITTNVLVSSLLLLGGSQGFSETTGMHVIAASFLLPMGVCLYTLFGGLKATFLSDWIHTVIIYIIICVSCFSIYASSNLIGSPGMMWDLLQQVQEVFPSETGSNYLNFKDKDMLLLTWSVTLGGFSSVFGDPGYSQRAIASDSRSVFYGYVFGGICWFVVPWALGSSAGLACRALLTNPVSVTYPRDLTVQEINSGMPVIYGLKAVLGNGGASAGLLMLFMSVTSATSAELIAFSSISTYDIYQAYFKPDATGKQLISFAHLSVVGFSIFMASLSIVFNYIGVTVGWLLSFLGIILSPEVSALILAIYWKKMSKNSLVFGAPLGTLTGILCWIGATYHYGGHEINKTTLMITEATFIGNITALLSSFIYITVISLINPDDFDFNIFTESFIAGDDAEATDRLAMKTSEDDKHILRKHSIYSLILNLVLLFGAYIILPVSYYSADYTFSKTYFTQWIIIMILWLLCSTMYIIAFPLWQGRKTILKIFLEVFVKSSPHDVHNLQMDTSSREIKKNSYTVEIQSINENQ